MCAVPQQSKQAHAHPHARFSQTTLLPHYSLHYKTNPNFTSLLTQNQIHFEYVFFSTIQNVF